MAAWMLPAAIVASAAISKMGGGDKSSGSATRQPAPWESDPKKIWDDYIDSLFGSDTRPSRGEVISENDKAQRGVFNKYLGTTSTAVDDVLNTIGALQTGYLKPATATIGGQGINFIPRSSRQSAADMLDFATKGYALKESQAGKELEYGLEYTPYRSADQYYKEIMPIAMQMQGMRYGIPTESAEYTEPLSNTLMKSAYFGKTISDILGKKKEPQVGYDQDDLYKFLMAVK